MKAEETIISDKEVAHIIFKCEGTVKDAKQEVNLAQAQIAFKAGMREVVETFWDDIADMANQLTISKFATFTQKWQAKLKDWGLDNE